MIYDKILTIYPLLPGRSPAVRKLKAVSQHFYLIAETLFIDKGSCIHIYTVFPNFCAVGSVCGFQ